MENVMIIIVVAVILALAIGYVVKAKKSGRKCIGCPGGSCNGSCSGCCGCGEKFD